MLVVPSKAVSGCFKGSKYRTRPLGTFQLSNLDNVLVRYLTNRNFYGGLFIPVHGITEFINRAPYSRNFSILAVEILGEINSKYRILRRNNYST